MSNSNSQLEQAIIDYRIKCDMAVSELKDGFYTQEDYEKAIKWELDRLLALLHSREQEIVQRCMEALPEKKYSSGFGYQGILMGIKGIETDEDRPWNAAIDQATAALKQIKENKL